MSSREKVARERLAEKVQRVRDAQSQLQVQFENLDEFGSYGDDILSLVRKKLETWLDDIQNSVENSKMRLLEKIDEISKARTSMLTNKREIVANTLQECSTSLTNSLLDDSSLIIQQYSSLSQQLESSLINTLTILDDTSCQSIDELISALSNAQLTSSPDSILKSINSHLSPFEDILSDIQSNIEVALHEDANLLTNSYPIQATSNSTHSNSPLLERHTDEGPTAEAVPYLHFTVGSCINVVIISILSLTSYVAQPFGENLVELSIAIREHVLLKQQEGAASLDQFLSSLRIGQVCCAQFSVDQCWYRAKIEDLKCESLSLSHQGESALVRFIDYGNTETLPLSHLLPLPISLATLPAQALTLSLHNVVVPPCPLPDNVTTSVHQWMELALNGTIGQIQVINCRSDNNMSVELFVPTEVLMSFESTTIMHQSHMVVPKWMDFTKPAVNFGLFLSGVLSNSFDIISTGSTFTAITSNNFSSTSTVSSVAGQHPSVSSSSQSLLISLPHSSPSSNIVISLPSPTVPLFTAPFPPVDLENDKSSSAESKDNENLDISIHGNSINDDSFHGDSDTPPANNEESTVTSQMLPSLQEDQYSISSSLVSIEDVLLPPPNDFVCCYEFEATPETISCATEQLVVTSLSQNTADDGVGELVNDITKAQSNGTASSIIVEDTSGNLTDNDYLIKSDKDAVQLENRNASKVLTPDELTPPTDLSIGKEFVLFVSHVVNPYCLYVFPEDNGHSLNILEMELNSYYLEASHCKELEDVCSEKICCIKCCDIIDGSQPLMCRGIVLSVVESIAEVLCVDYGLVKSVPINQLLVLEPWFFDTPIQCIRCCLAGIAPVSSTNEEESASLITSTNEESAPVITSNNEEDAPVITSTNEEESAPVFTSTNEEGAPVTNEEESAPVITSNNEEENASVITSTNEEGAPVITSTNEEGAPVITSTNEEGALVSTSVNEESAPAINSTNEEENVITSTNEESAPVITSINTQSSDGSWSIDSTNFLISLVKNKLLVGMITDKKDVIRHYNYEYSILLYDTNDETVINTSLIDNGMATYLTIGTSEGTDNDVLKNWDPMQSDFLSHRNVYEIDDEDVSSALLGYKSSNNRVCRYYNTVEGCYEGDNCRFQHLPEGVSDEICLETYTSPLTVPLPLVGATILVVVTAIQSLTCFMVHFMGPAELLLKDAVAHTKFIKSKFATLMKEMDLYYSEPENRSLKVFVPPHMGELIAAWCEFDGHWYRAIARDQYNNEIHVFYIDVGNEEWVSQERIREIAPEFIHLPGQAIECKLDGIALDKEKIHLSKNYFEELVKDQLLFAEVKWRTDNGVMGLELYSLQEDASQKKQQISLNQKLLQLKYAFPVKSSPSKKSSLKKGSVKFVPG